jgi:nascent polypeptide-associated complex subunit alpha
MPNQEMFQITGDIVEEEKEFEVTIGEDDIRMVAEQAGVSKDKAKKALEETKGNIAEAIMKLKK